jgi:HSP20 family protein
MKIVKINNKPKETYYTPMNSLIDDLFGYAPLTRFDDIFPAYENIYADIWEKDNKIFLKTALPGIKKEDINITIDKNTLTIEGKSEEEKEEKDGKKYYLKNFSSYSYSQRFNLPAHIDVDNVEAEFKDGVLTVQLSKTKEAESKKIEIK